MSSNVAHARVQARHAQTVPRELVHRSAVSEVFVTSLAADGSDRFVAGVQLPRMHAFYGDHAGNLAYRYDPLAVMEAARQAAMAITHEFYAVPVDMAFLVRTFNGKGADTSAWEVGAEPADLRLDIQVPQRHQQQGRLCGVEMVLEITRAGTPMMTVDGSFSWTTHRQWSGLRTAFRESLGLAPDQDVTELADSAEPAGVGRNDQRNVVLGPIEHTTAGVHADIIADTGHPFLFDHPLDHMSGSLLIEAARQAGMALVLERSPRLLTVTSTFDRFVELDLPARCSAALGADEGGRLRVDCRIEQAGVVAAHLGLTFGTETSEEPR